MLKLKINNSTCLGLGIKALLKMTEDLSLEEMNGVRNVLYELDMDGFPHLKHLLVKDCLELLYIIKSVAWNLAFPKLESLILRNLINLEKICHGQLNAGSLSKLRIMKIEKCDRLEYLFASSVARNITQLQQIEVTDCKNLKEIFGEESKDHGDEIETNDKIDFNQLCSLTLQRLPQFIKIGSDMRVAFPNLEVMVLLRLDNLQLIWHNQQLHAESFRELKVVRVEFCEKLKTIVPSNSHGLLTFHNLKELIVKNCWSMKSLFPVTIATGLVQLNDLRLVSCGLEEIVSEEEVKGGPNFLFPQLTVFHLDNLPKLKCFYSGLHTTEWPLLNSLCVYGCKKIKIYASEFPSFQRKDDGESQPAIFLLEKVL
ncbi:hypothetical protein Patl1_21967 [Pistacia atlantica]|uniref:Uncharacterized protein n=1 Tax=Pistacia atlantica TaxID=434234 RepID=A0ACC1BI90_9ROSI|nr:hypothetical protein Patl1_21967 [Pistacia atlantica]